MEYKVNIKMTCILCTSQMCLLTMSMYQPSCMASFPAPGAAGAGAGGGAGAELCPLALDVPTISTPSLMFFWVMRKSLKWRSQASVLSFRKASSIVFPFKKQGSFSG